MEPISVIIITYNEEVALPRLLEQIKTQTMNNMQIIIVDSNSIDRTPHIALQYQSVFDDYIFHNLQKTEGPSLGRNTGAKIAKHNILLFLDADTILPSDDFIKKTITYYKKHHLDVASCYIQPNTPKREHTIGCALINMSMRTTQHIIPTALGGYMISHKTIHDKIGGFDQDIYLCEDAHYAKESTKYGTFAMIPEKFIFDMRRIEKEGIYTMVNTYTSAHIKRIFGQELRKNDNKKITYKFGDYT